MTAPAIDAQKVARRFGRRWALASVSLQVAEGSVTIVAGHNGSGKSTLLRLLASAIRPDSGSLRVGGFDVVAQREDVRRITALMTHQTYLYEALTARENLRVVADSLGTSADVDGLLRRVGLEPRAGDPVTSFSAGKRKRLMVARLLLQQPRIALVDEPYGQLDAEGFDLLDALLAELRAGGSTIVIATHQLERASRFATAALILREGRMAWEGLAADARAAFSKC